MQYIFKLDKENKIFYKTLLTLCIPIIIQNLLSTLINMVDTIMVGGLGEVSVAAIGIANQYFFLYNMALSGIIGGAGLFIAQFFGKNDKANIRKITALGALSAITLGIIFGTLAILSPKFIIHFFSLDESVIEIAVNYFLIIGFCYPIIAISNVFSMGSRSIRNPKLGMICSSISLGLNIILNYIFIFGKFGMPALGTSGAALATVISRIVELILLVSYVYFIKSDYELRFTFKDIKLINKDLFKAFISKTIPVFFNDTLWAFGTVLYAVAYSKAGTSAIAASQIASSTGNFFIMTSVCIAIGSSIMIGNELGADHIEKAVSYSKKFAILVCLVGLVFGGLLILSIPALLKVFSVSSGLAPDIKKIFIIMGVLMALKTFNTFIIIGVLRSGGDTKYALTLEMGCMWFVSLPLTFFAAYKGVPIYVLVALTYTEEIAKFIFGVPRALSKKWANNIVKDI
ncbi:MATE family efflux transporter [Terrisporobacter sp.]|uniref:MATE family efflux transporter n=1 Tax=Terrisporobacter sp. TaxID=1965305 RepID=UPI001A8F375A|nr:MATE family efflux transporter [Terrisporobacter sp.]MBN9648187.1 MATE family efflux transporter [Terrisporobacter glycolicus]